MPTAIHILHAEDFRRPDRHIAFPNLNQFLGAGSWFFKIEKSKKFKNISLCCRLCRVVCFLWQMVVVPFPGFAWIGSGIRWPRMNALFAAVLSCTNEAKSRRPFSNRSPSTFLTETNYYAWKISRIPHTYRLPLTPHRIHAFILVCRTSRTSERIVLGRLPLSRGGVSRGRGFDHQPRGRRLASCNNLVKKIIFELQSAVWGESGIKTNAARSSSTRGVFSFVNSVSMCCAESGNVF